MNNIENLNIPLSPSEISEDGNLITCRNCNEKFIKAKRCTFCGQLIAYSDEKIETDKISNDSNQNDFASDGINNGETLYNYLMELGLTDLSCTAIDTNANVIRLPNYITFNWRKDKKQVRVNCKKDEMQWIEFETGYKHIDNGTDRTHPFSFLLDNVDELINVVGAIKRQ